MTLIFAGCVSAILFCLGIYTPSRVDSRNYYTLANAVGTDTNNTIALVADVSFEYRWRWPGPGLGASRALDRSGHQRTAKMRV